MADLTFASYLQGPLGGAIEASDGPGTLPPPAFTPALTLSSSIAPDSAAPGPHMRLLGPGHVTGLAPGTVVRTDPPAGGVDVEPNYLAVAEVVPPELPWVLTPARPAGGRLRPWFVLIVLEAATTPLMPGAPLPSVEAPVAELPDLVDSWGWAHVQRVTGSGELPGGGQATARAVARLICPRRLAAGVAYRACLVPSFSSGVAAGLGDDRAGDAPNAPAWDVDQAGTVRLPVYHEWTFTTGLSGDFENLVTRLTPADESVLDASAERLVDVGAPWPGDVPLSPDPQRLGVQGALVPFGAPPPPDGAAGADVLAAIDRRLRGELDAPAVRLSDGPPGDETGALAAPIYGGRHVLQGMVEGPPPWLAQLNLSVANRIAAGLGAAYVRANQEDLMARAWEQAGAIREANQRRAVVELTTGVSERIHARHVTTLMPAETLALAAPASARTLTSRAGAAPADRTTLAMETRMSRLPDGAATTAFARHLRPRGKLARRAGVTVGTVVPRALAGEVEVPAGAPVIPDPPQVATGAAGDVASVAAASQLVAATTLAAVATVNGEADAGAAVTERLEPLGLDQRADAPLATGRVSVVAAAIGDQVQEVTAVTTQLVTDMRKSLPAFGTVSQRGVPVAEAAIAARVAEALDPGDSHVRRLESQTAVPDHVFDHGDGGPLMTYPEFPAPIALALLASDPEWLISGLGAFPPNSVTLLRENDEFVASYLVGMNHEMMRELLWREYPTDLRGTPFSHFWPRPDGSADIPPIHTWTGDESFGSHLSRPGSLTVLLVRGDVVRRYPGMVVTAIPSGPPDGAGRHRPDATQAPRSPLFVVAIDESTAAYAFDIPDAEIKAPATAAAPGWFFVFAEHGFRIRFGFDEPPASGAIDFGDWNAATWPVDDRSDRAFVPVARGHAIAGAAFGPPGDPPITSPAWAHDSADVARIALQRPFRVAIQADVLLHPGAVQT